MKRIFNGSGGRKTALILSLCLIFALAVGTTFALLKASTAPVENTFTAENPERTSSRNWMAARKRASSSKTPERPCPMSASSWS